MIKIVFAAIGFVQFASSMGLIVVATTSLIRSERKGHLASVANALAIAVACTSAAVLLAYLTEYAIAFFSENPYEMDALLFLQTGDQAYRYWIPLFARGFLPQLCWIGRFRKSYLLLFAIACVLLASFVAVDVDDRSPLRTATNQAIVQSRPACSTYQTINRGDTDIAAATRLNRTSHLTPIESSYANDDFDVRSQSSPCESPVECPRLARTECN